MTSYQEAGVNIDAANQAVAGMSDAVRASHTPAVRNDIGSFGGLYALDALGSNSLLAASTDGVGTKVELAARLQRWNGLGWDLVNHCTNDILVQNARPMFFLDYVATSSLDSNVIVQIVTGLAEACQANGCALLGGETAEMPGVYTPGSVDIAGTIVGSVQPEKVLPNTNALRPGHVLIGLPSSGPHTNGYSLIRKIIEGADLNAPIEAGGPALADLLLEPHRSYVGDVDLLQADGIWIDGLCHITGGGFFDNIPRVLPEGVGADVDTRMWTVPPLFQWLQQRGNVSFEEAYRVWNMGIGFIVMVPDDQVAAAMEIVPGAVPIGSLVERDPSEPAVKLLS